ncbi:MAG: TolC family protein [Rhodocyclaceae bacterium]|nr:TolC family protein [Rhodocyclaceae bacterium]HNQ55991.1 TolC family protein [Candidatus Desulfobacillus denitrificans]HNT62011.1 TolC family protein [Candidatus Desulfobacillus denitrificans]
METDFSGALRRGALLAAAALIPLSAQAADPFGTLAAVPPPGGLRAVPAPCQPADLGKPLDLAEVVDLALCNNPQTRLGWANARYQAALAGVAQSAFLPTLSADASVTRIRNEAARGGDPYTLRSAGIGLAYVLFDFGLRSANLESARQLFAAAASTRDATVQSVFLSAMQAYFQKQASAAALEAARQSEKAALESLNAAEARYRVGSATPADRLQARTAHSQATLSRIGAEGAAKTAQGMLANVLGTDPTRELELLPMPPAAPGAGFEADVARLIEEARQRRPDLAAAEAQFRAAQAGIDAARAGHLPTLSLGVGAGRSQASGLPAYDSSTIGLTLTIPIFSGFSTTYKVHAAEAQADAQAARREQLRLQVALDVWNAYASLATATQSVKTAEELLESASQSERVAAGRYRAGVGSILDLLLSQAALANARQSRIQAGYNWFVSRAALAQSMGALDAGLLTTLSPGPSSASGRGELREPLRGPN